MQKPKGLNIIWQQQVAARTDAMNHKEFNHMSHLLYRQQDEFIVLTTTLVENIQIQFSVFVPQTRNIELKTLRL